MDQISTFPIGAADPGAGEHVTVSGGAWALTAHFSRLGPDLLLVGNEGQQQLIPDYFSSDSPPDIVTDTGAVIPSDLAVKLAGPVAPGEFAQAVPAIAADPIGRVETTSGNVEVTHADGSKVTLGQGAALYSGDVIETGAAANIGIVLADDSTLSLAANGRMVMDEVAYDPSAETGNATISVVQGVFSFVSGQIAKVGPDAMVLRTPVAQIGIRGTKIAGVAAAEGQNNTISLLPDADGSIGEVSVSNSAGIVILNQPGATTQVASAFQTPAAPVVRPMAQIQQQFSAALRSLPATPPPRNSNDDQENKPAEGGDN
ncbi:MAG: FecR domain-containing protein, partial [Rhodospirillales bacterium]|nr:FecR domain-containing protein [Rhodospirillales bacterium]